MLPQKIFKFRGSEMLFPALSTGYFNKYERKCKWLEYILPISGVVDKVQCLRENGKRITSKGQDSLYDRRYFSSLLRNIPCDSLAKSNPLTLQTGKIKDTNIMRTYQKKNFQMRVYGSYAPGFYNLVDKSPFTCKSKDSKYIHLL